jgi:hypothetical protein
VADAGGGAAGIGGFGRLRGGTGGAAAGAVVGGGGGAGIVIGGTGGAGSAAAAAGAGGNVSVTGGPAGADGGGGGANGGNVDIDGGALSGAGVNGVVNVGTGLTTSAINLGQTGVAPNLAYAADALGGGAAATLGTIGGTGPTAAGQAEWVQIRVNGNLRWLPVWL